MKLGDVKTEGSLKVLVYGNAGTGKTCFAAGFPYPILYLDFDGKVDSAALYYRQDKERLSEIDVRVLAKGSCEAPIEELNRIYEEELSGESKYKTLVLDSITTFSSLVLEHIVKSNPGVKRNGTAQGLQPCMQDYGILKREFTRLIPNLLALPMNVVMLGHIGIEKDELTGEIIRGPLMDGSFARQLPIYFKEVWYSNVDKSGKYIAQTKSDFKFPCRSQIPGVPAQMPLSYQELEKYL